MGADRTPEEAASEPQASSEDSPALRVIDTFGGIRPMAHKLEAPVSTVQGWKARGVIPVSRHDEVRAAAEAHGIALDEDDLAAAGGGEAAAEDTPDSPAVDERTRGDSESAASETGSARSEAPDAKSDAIGATAAADLKWAAEPPSYARRRGDFLPAFLLGALVLAIGAGGAVMTRDLWAPRDRPDTAVNDLMGRLGGMESRLTTLESRPATEAPSLEGLATAEQLADLETRISAGDEADANLARRLDGTESGLTVLAGLEVRLAEAASADAALRQRMDAAESHLASLETLAETGAAAVTALEELRAELAGLNGKLDEADARLAEADANLEALIAREEAARAAAAHKWALSLAVAQLRDAMQGAGPFAAEFDLLKSLATDDPGLLELLEPLTAFAESGIPTRAGLRRAFPPVAIRVVAVGRDDADDTVLGDVLRRVSSVVSVRRIGEVEGVDAEAIVARAEARLLDDNLAGAVSELADLRGAASGEAEHWRQRAQARLDAEAAITGMTGLLAAGLSGG